MESNRYKDKDYIYDRNDNVHDGLKGITNNKGKAGERAKNRISR